MNVALVERFVSVQGEGYNAGRSAYFIRFAGCNLDCLFANGAVCDTPWHKAKEKLTVDELMIDLGSYAGWHEKPIVVITGGEPTMAPAFDAVVLALLERQFYVAVETNGTIWRDSLAFVRWVTVSPKVNVLTGSGDPQLSRKVIDMPPQEYRWVIGGREDKAPQYYPANKHYVSPALLSDGSGRIEAAPQFVPGALERCLELVHANPLWRLSLQTHKWIGQR